MDETTMKLGLLMEAAQTHQTLAEKALLQLDGAVDGLDVVIHEEVRHAFTHELQELCGEIRTATHLLRTTARAAAVRRAGWSAAVATLCSLLAVFIVLVAAGFLLPSHAQVAALRAEYGRLADGVERLSSRGGRADLRRCGEKERVCVRVDLKAPVFGAEKDYFIIKGY